MSEKEVKVPLNDDEMGEVSGGLLIWDAGEEDSEKGRKLTDGMAEAVKDIIEDAAISVGKTVITAAETISSKGKDSKIKKMSIR